MAVLDRILASTRAEIAALGAAELPAQTHAPIDVAARLRRGATDPLRLIAENKRRSPSAGPLSTALSVAERAVVYRDAGATMISVLVDRAHFDGDFAHLAVARAAVGEALPLLCKGFVIDEAQLDAAAAHGADAALLIARILPGARLGELVAACRARRLTPIVEVVDEGELAAALTTDADVIGVNARDLDTLTMDAARAARVLAAIPAGHVALHFSGVGAAATVRELGRRDRGRALDGALIGEALMRQDDPRALLAEMVAAAAEEARGDRAR